MIIVIVNGLNYFMHIFFECIWKIKPNVKIKNLPVCNMHSVCVCACMCARACMCVSVCVFSNGHGGLFEVPKVVGLMYEQTDRHMHEDACTDSDWSNNRCVL